MKITAFKLVSTSVLLAALAACGGGAGGSPAPTSTSTTLTVTGTAATGLAIAGATVIGKCKVGTGTATTLADGTFSLVVTDGQLPCVLQITNPVDGTKLHTVAIGTGSTATANITPLTEMTTARVLGGEPNVFFAAFDATVAVQKVTMASVRTAQTDIGLVLTGTIDTTAIGDFISTRLIAATQGNPTSGDAQDKLLDALKLKLSSAQIGTLTTALASNQTADAIKQTVINLTTTPTTPPTARAGATQSVVTGTTVTLDASTSSAATGSSLTYAWTLTSKPVSSAATLVSPATAKPTFVADVDGSYVASVIVNDGKADSSAAAVTVTASVTNAAPVANAGVAKNVVAGSVVALDGSASSDANSDPLTYVWTLTSKPSGSSAALTSPTSAKPTFTADVLGRYVVSLAVNDGKIDSAFTTTAITATAASFAYVVNYGANNVSAYSIDATTGALNIVGTFATKTNFSTNPLPYSLTVDPTGKFAYVPNWSSNNIDVFTIDATTGALNSIATIANEGNSPYSVTFDPSGKFAYVANMNSDYGSAYSFNSTTGAFISIGRFAAGSYPSPVTFDPSGRFAYVATYTNGSHIVSTYTLNSATGALTSISTIAGGDSYNSIKTDPTGKYAYVVNSSSSVTTNGNVSAYTIDASTGALTSIGTFAAGNRPQSITIAPSGKFAYVVNFGTNATNGVTNGNVSAFSIDTITGALTDIGTFAAGSASKSIAIDPTGKFVYVVNYDNGTVSAYSIDASSGALNSTGTFSAGRMSMFITTTKR